MNLNKCNAVHTRTHNVVHKEETPMRRSPQEIVDTIAYSLKEGKSGDEYQVSDLVKKTFMNHVTVSYYLDLIMHVQNNLPKIEYVEKKRNSFVRILKEAEMPLSNEEYILLSLFDKGAFTKSKAVLFFEESTEALNKLIESSLLLKTSEKVFLLPEGIIMAAELADKRAEFVLSPPEKKVIERGVEKIEEWPYMSNIKAKTDSNILEECFCPSPGAFICESPAA